MSIKVNTRTNKVEATTFPAVISTVAAGNVDYKVYGAAEGAGVQTENLFDSTKRQSYEGFWNNTGGYVSSPGWYGTLLIDVEPSTEYSFNPNSTAGASAKHLFYDENVGMIGYISSGRQTFTTPDNCVMMRFSYRSSSSNIMLVKSSTVPATYIPYGYQIPLTVESGEESATTPIYIGDSKLMAEEYVDYESGKVYKRTENIVFSTIPAANVDTAGKIISRSASYLAIAPIEQGKSYSFMTEDVVLFAFYASLPQMGSIAYDNTRHGGSETGGVPTFTAPITGYVVYRNTNNAPAMLIEGDVVPETYIPYLQPTDPPVALPEISTYQGDNTLSFETTVQPEKLELTSASSNLLKEETITKILRTEDDGQGTVNEHILYDATN